MSGTVVTCKQSPEKILCILVIIDVVCSTVSAIFYGIAAILVLFTAGTETTTNILKEQNLLFEHNANMTANEITGEVKKTGYVMFLTVLLVYMLELYLFRLIRDGMKIDHFRLCKKWLAIRVVVFGATLGAHLFISLVLAYHELQIFSYLFLVYAFYELVVGLLYIKDLHAGITFHGNPPDWQRPKWQIA